MLDGVTTIRIQQRAVFTMNGGQIRSMSMQQLIDMLEKLTVALNNINVIERRVSDLESRSTDSVDEDMIRETVSGMNFSLDDGDFSGCLDNCSVSAD